MKKYKYILLLFLCSIILSGGCSGKLTDSSITDEDIKNYTNKNNNIDLQLLQDLNNNISIMLISGFEILNNNNEEDKLILKAFNKDKDISLSVFNFGKISKIKKDYFSNLKRILIAQKINFIEQNDSIMYKLQYKKDENNINEICFVVFSKNNNLYSVCVNSKSQSLDNLQNSINSIKIK